MIVKIIFNLIMIIIAQHSFGSEFVSTTDRTSHEFNLALESIMSSDINDDERIKILKLLETINQSLEGLSKEQSLFLSKEITTRTILESDQNNNFVFYFNQEYLDQIEEKSKSDKNYSTFSLMIIRSVIADIKPFLNSSYNKKNLDKKLNKEKIQIQEKIQLLLKYLQKWLQLAYHLDDKDFNLRTNKVALEIIQNLASTADIFKHHTKSTQKEITFKISKPAPMTERFDKDENIIDIKEDTVPTVEDMSQASPKIDEKIQEIEPN